MTKPTFGIGSIQGKIKLFNIVPFLLLAISVLFPVPVIAQQNFKHTNTFVHRSYLGWFIDFSETSTTEPWPSIKMNDSLMADYSRTLDFNSRRGMNEITIWGLFSNRNWDEEPSRTITPERAVLVKKVIAMAHARGLKILCGMGIHSWGFDRILKAHPELACPCNPEVMDAARPAAWLWQKKVLDYVIDRFDFDGMSLQSADRGGCTCRGDAKKAQALAYQAAVTQKAVAYLRQARPHWLIGIGGWGMRISTPEDLIVMKRMTHGADYFIDVEETALQQSAAFQQELIQALSPCTYGSTVSPNVEPIQGLPRDYYFVPTVGHTARQLKALYDRGGRAAEAYAHTLANTGDRITAAVSLDLLERPQADYRELTKTELSREFNTEDPAARDSLLSLFDEAEKAWFTSQAGKRPGIILLMPREQLTPSFWYLDQMNRDTRFAYLQCMRSLRNRLHAFAWRLPASPALQNLQKSLENVSSQ